MGQRNINKPNRLKFLLGLIIISFISSLTFNSIVLADNNKSSSVPDINNLATACANNVDDPICRSITQAMYDFKDFQNRSLEYMVKKASLGYYEKLTITGLSMLVNRKIELKNKSFFSDKINQNLELRESSAVFSFEYNF
jgi:hypothetical protein